MWLWLLVMILLVLPLRVHAITSSLCSNCHTMHNSFQGSSMTNGTSSAQPLLLKYTCLGCHGMGGSQKIAYIGDIPVPQVLHTDPSGDLAGGNFAYITGAKQGNGTNPNRFGHNVIELGEAFRETAFGNDPPGHVHSFYGVDVRKYLSCAGYMGCHGDKRYYDAPQGTAAIKGAHHNNLNGKIDPPGTANPPGYYYRFLQGVKGYEISDWQNLDSTHHNEYYGSTSAPVNYGSFCENCHTSSGGVLARYGTISNFCATCHGNFHQQSTVGTSSPWLRHPTDVVIPNTGEFGNYTVYDPSVPVGRTYVPSSPSSTVTPGQDVVTCLSCHYAHAGPYPSMLRWNYSNVEAGRGSVSGCKVCHRNK
ncbi:MAG: hypothetical protein ACPLSJ_00620 [Thermosulfidibacteraceae bacterium]|mgnify:CR=1 FL=1